MALRLVTSPAEEPVSLEEVKQHLRIDSDEFDSLLTIYIQAARQNIDGRNGWLGRALVTQEWELSLDYFPAGTDVRLPLAPLQSVTSVVYDDEDGLEQILSTDDYTVDTGAEPGWIVIGENGWPTTLSAINAVRIRFVAGYGDAADVPAPIKAAILLMVGDLYQNRETTIGGSASAVTMSTTVENLLAPYRIWAL